MPKSFDDLVARARRGDADAGRQLESVSVHIARFALEAGDPRIPLHRAIRAEGRRIAEQRELNEVEDQHELIRLLACHLSQVLVRPSLPANDTVVALEPTMEKAVLGRVGGV